MRGPRVHFKVTFVSAKHGNVPPVKIENPSDITEKLDPIGAKDYSILCHSISELVEDNDVLPQGSISYLFV